MTGNPDTSLMIDTHHRILPDFLWQETENAHAPVGGLSFFWEQQLLNQGGSNRR